jgi:hypothetical protein
MDKKCGVAFREPLFESKYSDKMVVSEAVWPPEDESETAKNHARRIERNRYDDNTR